jgi:peptidyl-prolyl cis-trans isomerase A (cyclophilin A)
MTLAFARSHVAALAVSSLALFASPHALAQTVKLATSMGDIVLELDAAKAPKTVDNFVKYVKAGHYDGTIFIA